MNKIFLFIFSIFIISFNQILRLSANDDTYINSSNITYNERENIIELAENSKINFENTNILLDRGIIDYDKDVFEVFGNFYLYENLTILSGQNLKGNTDLNTFTADNVSYIYNDDLKVDSEKLDRDNNLLYFYNNFLTPCELEGYFNCPTWSIRINKTQYDIKEDKFIHFDSFLQIADYKVFYLPYFSHYGSKAPRKKGVLIPTVEFTVGGAAGLIIPYYIPLNQNTDILFRPKIYFGDNLDFLEKYELSTLIENRGSGGNTSIKINNINNSGSEYPNSSIRIESKQILNRNSVVSASGLLTNSISTTRSINEEPIAFEDLYFRVEKYNYFTKDDYLKTELSTIESFESSSTNSIPLSPSLNYMNSFYINDYSISNDIGLIILKRDNSSSTIPSESLKINFNNELTNTYKSLNFTSFNKLYVSNSYSDYYFNHEKSLNDNSYKSYINISSELYSDIIKFSSPRIKFILPMQLENTNKTINEDSQSITFNYQNQFSENRFYGSDLYDTSPRVVYGFENSFYFNEKIFDFNINQSFETNAKNSYSDKINQKSNFSDYALETTLNAHNILFKIDTRLDEKNLSKKEMNYSLNFENFIDFSLNYNETQSEAFKYLSNDTQSITLDISKKINENINLSFNSNLDVKNDYSPYKSLIELSLFDECSQLDIGYTNTRYNDNFNTKPEETISITFSMDYLGFFGYEQSTNLFFREPGELNYGL